MITATGPESAPAPARPRWASGRRLVLLIVAALALIGGAVTGVVVASRPGAPPSLIPGLSDDRPDPAKGISGGSMPMGTTDIALQLGTFLCATRDVPITGVSLYRPTPGIELVRWGVENETITMNGAADSLAQLGPFTSHAITQRCRKSDHYSRVGLQLHRTRPGRQSFLGLRVTYRSDGRQKVAYLWERCVFLPLGKAQH